MWYKLWSCPRSSSVSIAVHLLILRGGFGLPQLGSKGRRARRFAPARFKVSSTPPLRINCQQKHDPGEWLQAWVMFAGLDLVSNSVSCIQDVSGHAQTQVDGL